MYFISYEDDTLTYEIENHAGRPQVFKMDLSTSYQNENNFIEWTDYDFRIYWRFFPNEEKLFYCIGWEWKEAKPKFYKYPKKTIVRNLPSWW